MSYEAELERAEAELERAEAERRPHASLTFAGFCAVVIHELDRPITGTELHRVRNAYSLRLAPSAVVGLLRRGFGGKGRAAALARAAKRTGPPK